MDPNVEFVGGPADGRIQYVPGVTEGSVFCIASNATSYGLGIIHIYKIDATVTKFAFISTIAISDEMSIQNELGHKTGLED
jgi:hypothetical protein